MFSYSIKLRKINSPKLKGVATVTLDNIMEVDGFKVIEGSKGLFVSVPSHKGTIVEDGQKVEKYFDDVRFPGEQGQEFAEELKRAILDEYNSDKPSYSQSRSNTAQKTTEARNTAANKPASSAPPRARKPLWKV